MSKNKVISRDISTISLKCTNDNAVFIIDTDDFERIKNISWHLHDGYIRGKLKGKHIRLHALIKGKFDGLVIDHINRNKMDNRKINLRHVTRAQNNINKDKQKNNTSGYKGVSYCGKDKRPWHAEVSYRENGIRVRKTKTFLTSREAAIWYNDTLISVFGEHAVINQL